MSRPINQLRHEASEQRSENNARQDADHPEGVKGTRPPQFTAWKPPAAIPAPARLATSPTLALAGIPRRAQNPVNATEAKHLMGVDQSF